MFTNSIILCEDKAPVEYIICSGFGVCLFLVDGSVVVGSLVICALIVWVCVIGPCLALHYLVAFRFCNHLAKEEIACCFTLIVFLLWSVFGALCLFLPVSWVGLHV